MEIPEASPTTVMRLANSIPRVQVNGFFLSFFALCTGFAQGLGRMLPVSATACGFHGHNSSLSVPTLGSTGVERGSLDHLFPHDHYMTSF